MNNIYLLYKFNSYHDRVLKKFDTLSDYITSPQVYDLVTNANFDYKDGVTANVTYNIGTVTRGDEDTPNYALVVDSSSNILSRWYIVDGMKTRKGQYVLTLLRDGIADYFNEIKSAPIYLEKGTLSTSNKPFIYNLEDIEFNQIKTSETLLKDRTQCPWIVGFMAQKQPEGSSDAFTTTVSTNMMGQPDVTYSSMADYPYWAYMGNPWDGNTNYYKAVSNSGSAITTLTILVHLNFTLQQQTQAFTYYYTPNSGWVYFTGGSTVVNSGDNQTTAFSTTSANYPTLYRKIWRVLNNTPQIAELARQYASIYGSGIHTAAQGEAFAAEAGKIVKTNNSATQPTTGTVYSAGLYSLSVPYSSSANVFGNMVYQSDNNGDYEYCNTWVNTASDLQTAIINMMQANASDLELNYNGNYVTAGLAQEGKLYLVEATSTNATSITFAFTGNEKGLGDAPYRMFALPYNDNIVKWKFGASDANVIVSNKNINMSIAQGIAKTFSGTWLFDLQLVPFCPFVKSDRISVNSSGEVIIDIQGMTFNQDYNNIQDGSRTLSYILWCDYSQVDNYQIPFTINAGSTAEDIKVNNQCDMYRLSSPSYNSIYEFSAEKNNGLNGFDIDLVYKPYDSYIHINPNWSGLYGQDFNDARGLVFTGPFSLPQTTSAWQQYKLNNMNYQNSFDRQIENMDVMHGYDMKELGIKGITGAVSGAVSGAATGAMLGGGWGALAGGVLGAGASLVGAAADQQLATARYNETVDYTKDQFNMNLQNVKAQAQALSKVSSFTPNNKVFPLLEYYTCTEAEKDAFRLKLKYNGMKINAIMRIEDLYNTFPQNIEDKRYTKGKLIRLNINDDNHLVEHISEELNKGVFI